MTLAELKQSLHRFVEERAASASEKRAQLSSDLADAMLCLVRLAERSGIDLIDACQQRITDESRSQPTLVRPPAPASGGAHPGEKKG